MKFEAQRQDLVDAFSVIDSVVGQQKSLPALSHSVVQVTDDGLKIFGTSLIAWARCSAPANVFEKGEFGIPTRRILSLLRACSTDKVQIYSVRGDNGIVVKSGSFKSKFHEIDPGFLLWPVERAPENACTLKIQSEILAQSIENVIYASLKDVGILNGVLFDRNNKNPQLMNIVGCDGTRLAISDIAVGENSIHHSEVIQRDIAEEIAKVCSRYPDAEAQLTISPSIIVVEVGQVAIACPPVQGVYVDYNKIVDREYVRHASIDTDLLLGVLKRASVFLSNAKVGVELIFCDEKLEVRASTHDLGEFEESLPCTVINGPFKLAVRLGYLSDALSTYQKDSTFTIDFNDFNAPVLLSQGARRDWVAQLKVGGGEV